MADCAHHFHVISDDVNAHWLPHRTIVRRCCHCGEREVQTLPRSRGGSTAYVRRDCGPHAPDTRPMWGTDGQA